MHDLAEPSHMDCRRLTAAGRRFLASLLVVVGTACSTTTIPPDLQGHVLSVDANGFAHPRGGETLEPAHRSETCRYMADGTWREDDYRERSDQLDARVDRVVHELEQHLEDNPDAGIVIFLHGGLVPVEKALEEAAETKEALAADDPSVFPIFVNWETGIGKSYFDYLFAVRDGVRRPVVATLTMPFALVADAGSAIARTPDTVLKQMRATVRLFEPPEPVPESWRASEADGRRGIVDYAEDERTTVAGRSRQANLQLGYRILTLPTTLVSTPVLEMVGRPAYANMRRRARVLFQLDTDIQSDRYGECGILSRLMARLRTLEQERNGRGRVDPDGRNRGLDDVTALRMFQIARTALDADGEAEDRVLQNALDRCLASTTASLESGSPGPRGAPFQCMGLQEPLAATSSFGNDALRIRLVAHSMGSLVANDLLRRHSDLFFDEVIYLGAAASLDDFAEQAIPYLVANPTTRFQIRTLHPFNERSEWNYWWLLGLVPRGSLLEWIDLYLSDPRTELDRTMGSWNNLVDALPQLYFMESEARARLLVEGAGLGEGEPRKHGELNDPPVGKPYWRMPPRDEPAVRAPAR